MRHVPLGKNQETLTYYDYMGDGLGQKLSTKTHMHLTPTPTQRLALAVISLTLWLIAFYIIVQIIGSIPSVVAVTPPQGGGPPYSQDNTNWQHFLSQLLFVALAIFSILILALNLVFNLTRKR
ncbi:hypothetical protein KSX_13020 [Ktedonospora formicarum]|uniref:Uncharacterized protein n=2 Tax=Ktedonospora formicarum TaxID=2778364 RepID=A0A8J3HSY5_9CHLR|nr:hypothetical protein KSX_13020 [Ktedonospora formicarum]